jgi:acyl-coenzyme A thioesterase PaaI-like protein
MDHDLPPPPEYTLLEWKQGFGTVAGPLYERVGPNGTYARAFRVGSHQTNGLGNAHGGMLLTFADMAFGHAVRMQRNLWWVTVRLSCDFLSSARVGEWVEGNADVIGEQDDLFTVRGRVWVGDRIIMTGQGVFKGIAPRGE